MIKYRLGAVDREQKKKKKLKVVTLLSMMYSDHNDDRDA